MYICGLNLLWLEKFSNQFVFYPDYDNDYVGIQLYNVGKHQIGGGNF